MNISEQAGEVLAKVGTGAQYVGGGSAFVFGLTPSEWSVIGVLGGLFIGALGYITNTYFKAQHLKLAKAKAAEDEDGGQA